MNRRVFVTGLGAALAATASAAAQQPVMVHRIGVLEVVSQNLTIEYRSADGQAERFPDLAEELVSSTSRPLKRSV